jgi:hypothetical protein
LRIYLVRIDVPAAIMIWITPLQTIKRAVLQVLARNSERTKMEKEIKKSTQKPTSPASGPKGPITVGKDGKPMPPPSKGTPPGKGTGKK